MNLYAEAAAVLDKFENKQGSVKSLVFASGYKNVRQLYALVCESLKYRPVLAAILEKCHSLRQEEDLQGQGHLSTVLLYEHLMGKGLGRAGQLRKCIVKHKNEIRERCQKLLEEKGVTSLADLLSSQCQTLNNLPIPRYVRVNLLKTTVQAAVTMFTEDGWTWRHLLSLENFQKDVESLGDESFGLDPLLPDLLIFPPGTDLHDHPWVVGGSLVLQDRASCFPAHVLNPGKGATVLDCCAAPGNKTSHAASLMGNTGKIWAYERDGKRMALLQRQLRTLGVSNVKTVHQDFLSVNPQDDRFADVEYILVDPSCSGSGIMSRMDHISHTTATTDSSISARLASLQRFQISILKHALRFPGVRRVVYSTCSVHQEENERVIGEVALQVRGKFEVRAVFPQFPHRGTGEQEGAEKCVRMSPEGDLTNGFFVACFERISSADDVDIAEKADACEPENVNVNEANCEDGAAQNLLKKKKKRKRRKETDHTDVKSELHCCGADTVVTESPRNEHEENIKHNTLVSPQNKKKKKRKFTEESEHADATSDVNCDGNNVSVHQNGHQEADCGERPKKKRKKKCKHKRKDGKKEKEYFEVAQTDPPEIRTELCVPEMSSMNDSEQSNAEMSAVTDDLVSKKPKSSKGRNSRRAMDSLQSVQSDDVLDEPLDSSVREEASAEGKTRKKDKKRARESGSSSWYYQTESDPPSKKKKKDKKSVEGHNSSWNHQTQRPDLCTENLTSAEISGKTTKKKQKKKHHLKTDS